MLEEGNSIIYGLENQTRALSPQYAENDAVRFVIGTQNLKPQSNQVHVVELEEETGALHTKVFKHDIGEIWHLRCSPHDVATLMTTHNTYNAATMQCSMGVSLFKLPTTQVVPKDKDDLSAMQVKSAEELEILQTISPEKLDEEVHCADFHPTEANLIGIVQDGCFRIHDVVSNKSVSVVSERGRVKCTSGKWSPHQGGQMFAVLQDTNIKCYDTRTEGGKPSWAIDGAHRQIVRDIDFNPNRQFQLASGGDDASLNIWDYRKCKEPIFTRTDHSHWIWSLRYNTFHEQLILTGSSDARALLTAAASVCADDDSKDVLEDGVIQSYEQHEDSVYCVEWSSADPWTFASLSYDARLVLSTVPRHFKYKILLYICVLFVSKSLGLMMVVSH